MNTLQPRIARTGHPLGEPLPETTDAQVDEIAAAAADAFVRWAASTGEQRSALLRGLGAALQEDRAALVELADQETCLGAVRLDGELDRTIFQLNLFADIALNGAPFARTDDPEVPGAPPLGHPHLVRQQVPLGPVAMFSASNFPFAFSVLGGDTASALAAGCPVVVKAHTGHLLLSRRTLSLAKKVLGQLSLPDGLIGMIQGGGSTAGARLLRHPAIAAGAFTGSTSGGSALQAIASSRPRPIPFYGELGSINPLIPLRRALEPNGPALADSLAASITLGTGQFCTSPGLVVLIDSDADRAVNDAFVAHLRDALSDRPTHAMLTSAMRRSFDQGIETWLAQGVEPLLHTPTAALPPRPVLGQVAAADFIARPHLHEEVFGPAALIVRARSVDEAARVLEAVGGSLTVTIWGADSDEPHVVQLVRGAMKIAGRVLFKGVPTGVAVTAAQQHGGPWPSSTNPMTTSVGDAALARFLRPVALQDAPTWLLAREGRPV